MRMDSEVIKAGVKLRKIDRHTGGMKGWQKFEEDTPYKAEYAPRIWSTVLVVKNGPHKGVYTS